jgi:hypothetical protein
MKGVFTLGIYVAIGITGAAFGQSRLEQANTTVIKAQAPPPTYSPIPLSMAKAFATTDPLLEQLATKSAPKTAEITQQLTGIPAMAPPARMAPSIVIKYGQGGRVDEHRQQFANYQRAKAKVEIRGPCYSACTLILGYVEPENICIAEGAFMAFHAIRSMERGELMVGATHEFYAGMPTVIKMWIDDNGGWHNLPLDGYWTLHDRQLWARGYPQCK